MRQTVLHVVVVVVRAKASQRIITGDERFELRKEPAEMTDGFPLSQPVLRQVDAFQAWVNKRLAARDARVIIRADLQFFQTRKKRAR